SAEMSADDYAAMSTERVLKTFAETAKRTGSLFSRSPEKLKPSSARGMRGRNARAGGGLACAPAVRARPVAPVRRSRSRRAQLGFRAVRVDRPGGVGCGVSRVDSGGVSEGCACFDAACASVAAA